MIIDKNIPAPKDRISWPFSKMEIGDSFVAPWPNGDTSKEAKAFWRGKISSQAASRKGMKFKSQAIGEDGVRVWRIA